jgi:mannitol/fructose-specific phosphotransferase system IIA component (Ntr-type)
MKLVDLLPKSMLVMDLKSKDKKGAIREVLHRLVDEGMIKDDDAKKLERLVHKRESQGSTGIGKGLAIPHVKGCPQVSEMHGVFGRSQTGIPFEAVDGGMVHLIFLVVSPENMVEPHLVIMRKIAALGRDEKTLKYLINNADASNVVEIFKEVDDNFR